MAQFHFVEDYRRHVTQLMADHPIDDAMALAVGGDYDFMGRVELAILKQVGLRRGMSVVDLGCGSGRLATALGASDIDVHYTGTDVVPELLDYAASRAPSHYRFLIHRELSIPAPEASADIISAFSVFTHLLHDETFIYLRDMRRVLRLHGRIVFSFLEFADPSHWSVFEAALDSRQSGNPGVLVTHIERHAIETWATHLGMAVSFIDGNENFGPGALGQSVAVLEKPQAR